MKKGTMMVFSALLMSCFLAVPAEAKSIENGAYRVWKSTRFRIYLWEAVNLRSRERSIANS